LTKKLQKLKAAFHGDPKPVCRLSKKTRSQSDYIFGQQISSYTFLLYADFTGLGAPPLK
jgi:hypothetical protein